MNESIENIYRTPVYWRHTMSRPKFAFVDARLIFFVGLFCLHIRLWTFVLLFVAIATLSIASYLGLTLDSFYRYVRGKLAGVERPAISRLLQRQYVNYSGVQLRPLDYSKFRPSKGQSKLVGSD